MRNDDLVQAHKTDPLVAKFVLRWSGSKAASLILGARIDGLAPSS